MTAQAAVNRYRAGARPTLLEAVRTVVRQRGLLYEFARRNLLMSSRGSVLGLGWIVVMPLLMMCLYSFVFGVIFGGRYGAFPDETGVEYALGIFLSLTVFQLFAEPMSSSPTLIANSPTLVKKVVFPLEVLPTAQVAAQVMRFLVSLSLVVVGAIAMGRGVQLTWLWLPLIVAPVIVLSLGVALLFSAVGVFVRDLAELTRVLSTLFLFGSGVFFSMDRLPEAARYVLGINPLIHLLDQARGAMLWGRGPDMLMLGYATVASFAVFGLGLLVFQRLRSDFADVV